MQFPTPAKVPPSFSPPGALNFGRGEPLYFGQIIYDDWGTGPTLPPIPAFATNVTPADLIEPPIMNGPAATDPLRVFGLTNEERVVNIALTVGVLFSAWLLLAPR